MTDFKVISPAEIVALGEFLDRESVFKRSMGIAMLDGFLTAIVIGPETVMPSEYLPWIWDRKRGKKGVTFKDQEEADRILGYLQGMQNRVAVPLMRDAPATPVFVFEPAWDHLEWMDGFEAGARFNGEIWDYAREDAPEIFEPLEVLATMKRNDEGWDDACREFGSSLVAIRDYFRAGDWRQAFQEVQKPFVREGPKIGRNDPCPCRSGRKFKKCCGLTGGAVH